MGQGQLALFFPATISRDSTLMIPTPRFLSGQSRLCSSRFLSFPGGDPTCERKLLEMAATQAMVHKSWSGQSLGSAPSLRDHEV